MKYDNKFIIYYYIMPLKKRNSVKIRYSSRRKTQIRKTYRGGATINSNSNSNTVKSRIKSSRNDLYESYPSTHLKLVKDNSEKFKCHMITPNLIVDDTYMGFPTFKDLIILKEKNTKPIHGWFMYILCWIKGKRRLVLLDGKPDDFNSKHKDMITVLSEKYKDGDIEYIISGEIYLNSNTNECQFDDNSGTFFQDYITQFSS